MGKYDKLFSSILCGRSDQSIRFTELTHLLLAMGLMNELMETIIFFTGRILRKY